MTLEVTIKGQADTEKALRWWQFRAKREMERLTRLHAFRLRDLVRENASHAPGPEIRTGAYVNSIHVEKLDAVDGVSSYVVLTEHPAAWRLEYGFVGRDSLGRHYAQPPRPHWRPAIAETEKAYPADLGKM